MSAGVSRRRLLRWTGAGAAVAGVAVLTAAVTRLAGRTSGVLAGLLAATSPLVVEYAAEGRMYGLALLATATAALGLARWLDDGRLGLWAVGATAAGLAHWFAVPVVAGLALAAAFPAAAKTLPKVPPALDPAKAYVLVEYKLLKNPFANFPGSRKTMPLKTGLVFGRYDPALGDIRGLAAPDRLALAVAYGSAAAGLPGTTIPQPSQLRTELVGVTALGDTS